MILTQSNGIIMGPVSKLLGFVFNAIYTFFNGMGVESIALSIVIFTVFVRLLLFPLNLKTTKSSKIQQFLKPEFNKITKKYKGKKDQESMLAQQKETRELQEKYGIKMTQGCLTSLIQFPVFIGLYNVIQNVPAYVPKIRALYEPIAKAIISSENGYKIMSQFIDSNKIPRLVTKLVEFATSTDASSENGIQSINSIIDVLYRCNDSLLNKLSEAFSSSPTVGSLIAGNSEKIARVNTFIFGINLSEAPGFKLTPALVIPVAAFVCQLLSMLVVPMNETGDPQQDAQMRTMRKTMLFMPVMSFIITVSAPAGLGIYWAVSAFVGFLITVCVNFYYDHIDMQKLVDKQAEKAAVNIQKRKASGKKSLTERFMETATGQPSEESSGSVSKNQKLNKYSSMNLKNYGSSDSNTSDDDNESSEEIKPSKNPKKGSLADKANAVKRFNDSGV